MDIDCTAWAPSREAAIQFLTEINVAKEVTVDGETYIQPVADVHITGLNPGSEITIWKTKPVYDEDMTLITPGVPVDGIHWNMRFYGDSAKTLTAGKAQVDAGGNSLGLFDRTHILALVSSRTGQAPEWKETLPPVPPGYEDPTTGCRCFDPAGIKTPANVWA